MYIHDCIASYCTEEERKAEKASALTKQDTLIEDAIQDKSNHLAAPSRPAMHTRSLSGGLFGNIYQTLSRQNSESKLNILASVAASKPATPSPEAQSKNAIPIKSAKKREIPKATWAGPSEGEVCLPPAWS